MKELILKVEKWAEDRNFYDPKDGVTHRSQLLKLYEEFGELCGSVLKGKDVRDDIGDNVVVLINLARLNNFSVSDIDGVENLVRINISVEKAIELLLGSFYPKMMDGVLLSHMDGTILALNSIAVNNGYTLKECLEVAYDEIKDRKGKMIKGVYVKESDL